MAIACIRNTMSVMFMKRLHRTCFFIDIARYNVIHSLRICRPLCDHKKRVEHLILTGNHFRQMKKYKGIVQELHDASSTIKLLRLKIEEPGFFFKAGQWVDFCIPGVEQVAGYSITSSPKLSAENGYIELAVKYSKFPPTYWIHTKCKVGDTVVVRVGGDFFYDPQIGSQDASSDLILIGGGVGINPMVSIVRHYYDIVSTMWQYSQGVRPGSLKLLYSVQKECDLVFKEDFLNLKEQLPSITCQFFTTSKISSTEKLSENIIYRRINREDLKFVLNDLHLDNVVCYLCGPSPMIDAMDCHFQSFGIPPQQIKFEKWW